MAGQLDVRRADLALADLLAMPLQRIPIDAGRRTPLNATQVAGGRHLMRPRSGMYGRSDRSAELARLICSHLEITPVLDSEMSCIDQ
jgi:hypothetical protein